MQNYCVAMYCESLQSAPTKWCRCSIWTSAAAADALFATTGTNVVMQPPSRCPDTTKLGHAQSHGLTRPCDRDACESVRRTAGLGTTWGTRGARSEADAACRTAADANRNLAPPRRRRREATTEDAVDAKESRIKADYKNTHAYVRDSTVDATSGAPWAGSP